jgi:hypothetical protein
MSFIHPAVWKPDCVTEGLEIRPIITLLSISYLIFSNLMCRSDTILSCLAVSALLTGERRDITRYDNMALARRRRRSKRYVSRLAICRDCFDVVCLRLFMADTFPFQEGQWICQRYVSALLVVGISNMSESFLTVLLAAIGFQSVGLP